MFELKDVSVEHVITIFPQETRVSESKEWVIMEFKKGNTRIRVLIQKTGLHDFLTQFKPIVETMEKGPEDIGR